MNQQGLALKKDLLWCVRQSKVYLHHAQVQVLNDVHLLLLGQFLDQQLFVLDEPRHRN
jgi:hypothetical protein